MLLTIHDANLQKIGFIDNEKQETLNFYDDAWTRNLETASSTFEFTVSKKELQTQALQRLPLVPGQRHRKKAVISVIFTKIHTPVIWTPSSTFLRKIRNFCLFSKTARAFAFLISGILWRLRKPLCLTKKRKPSTTFCSL